MGFAIETRDLTKTFGKIVAVDHISFHVEEGEAFGLLGPNGAGKTTTISMLCTILKPTSGTALVNGFDIVKEPSQVRKSVGIVFQDPSLDDRLTGRENLEMHAMLYGLSKTVRRERIDGVLKLVELEDRAGSLVRTYSGGMKRRLEIARGLIHYPKVLFLDEPTLGLDPQTREHIWGYIEELKERERMSIVLTTHYMDEADRLCDRIAIIDFGRIRVLGASAELKRALEGDLITVRGERLEELASKISSFSLARGVNVLDGTLRLNVNEGEKLIPRVVELAGEMGIRIESITLREPTLNDVFLHHTGREIRAEEGDEFARMRAMMRVRGLR